MRRIWLKPTCAILTVGLIVGCGGSGGSTGAAPQSSSSTSTAWGSCPTPSLSSSSAGTVGASVDSLAANEMQSAGVPGMTVELAKQGSIIYAQAYGYADLSNCTPLQLDTPFQLASVTKTFTATAILQLQSTGALDIDKPVITYLPGYSFDPRITVRMLLNHLSGLADYSDVALFPDNPAWGAQ